VVKIIYLVTNIDNHLSFFIPVPVFADPLPLFLSPDILQVICKRPSSKLHELYEDSFFPEHVLQKQLFFL
jgi:hypothetical protein